MYIQVHTYQIIDWEANICSSLVSLCGQALLLWKCSTSYRKRFLSWLRVKFNHGSWFGCEHSSKNHHWWCWGWARETCFYESSFSLKEGFWREAFLSGNSICTQCLEHLWLPGSLKKEDQCTEDGGLKAEGHKGDTVNSGVSQQDVLNPMRWPCHYSKVWKGHSRPIKNLKGKLLAI